MTKKKPITTCKPYIIEFMKYTVQYLLIPVEYIYGKPWFHLKSKFPAFFICYVRFLAK